MTSLYFAHEKSKSVSSNQTDPMASTSRAAKSEEESFQSSVAPMSQIGGSVTLDSDTNAQQEDSIPRPQRGGVSGEVSVASELTQETRRPTTTGSSQNPPNSPGANTAAEQLTTAEVTLVTASTANQTPTSYLETENEQDGHPQGHQEHKEEEASSNTLYITICVCLLLLAGAVGAAVGVAVSGGDDGEPTPPTDPGRQTRSPTIVPTIRPTLPPIDGPPNSRCTDATVLQNGATILGTTVGAVSDSNQITVGECGVAETDSPGVWYQVTGQGGVLTASTCGETEFDSKISVYEGGSFCTDLKCVIYNDDAPGSQCGRLSTAVWQGQVGVTYYILVRGFEGSTGDLEFSISAETLTNDDCTGAISLPVDAEFTLGSTVDATLDNVIECSGERPLAPGVWYQIGGTGGTVIISTCHGTQYDTKLTVYKGASCGELVCVAEDDDGCGVEQARVELETELGTMYYVLVHGYEGATGHFHLHVSTPETNYNDRCWDARRAPLNTYYTGHTLFAGFDFPNTIYCPGDATNGGLPLSGPTVWYEVIGTGAEVRASLCDARTTFDTSMSIFSGGCGSLTCVDGNDESPDVACGLTSEVQWKTEPFHSYLIAIHGHNGATGEYGFFVEDLGGSQLLESCEDSAGPVPFGKASPVLLSNNAVYNPSQYSCAASSSTSAAMQGAWVYALADGGTVTVSVCGTSPEGSSVYVYSGSCSDLTCVSSELNACSITWDSEPNEIYHIFIRGAGEGDYELSVSSTGPPPAINDLCPDAIPVEVDLGAPIYGSTLQATWDNVGFCGESVTAPGAWYSVVGTGNNLAVGLCEGTEFDTKVSVWRGSCDDLECVGGNDDFCQTKSAYEWASVEGVTYYILVHGFENAVGQFGILVITQ